MVDSEGWLKTGDICFFDGNGLLFYVDRMKDLIKYNAYQVTSASLNRSRLLLLFQKSSSHHLMLI